MGRLRSPHPALAGVEPYDPKYLPAEIILSANESPLPLPAEVAQAIADACAQLPTNRYPDPLANQLRDAIAQSYGLTRENVLVGNGGDELIFDLTLAWGGVGRRILTLPPTFGSYASFAQLVGTDVVEIARKDDFTIDKAAVLDRVAQGDIDIVVVCSPNNPTGDVAGLDFIEALLDATDALVLIDEAYAEFSEETATPLLAHHENLAILRTFSKAYRLAGARVGYLLASKTIISELGKVRMPYSVGMYQQAAAYECWRHREAFQEGINCTISERARIFEALQTMDGIQVFPTSANYILVRIAQAHEVWEALYERGILVRDFSANPATRDCLRISIGTPEENDALLAALQEIR